MRSGDLDTLIRIVRPGALQQQGRSRVPAADVLVADLVPAQMLPGVGTERFASSENAATAPSVFIVRREPDLETLDTTCKLFELKQEGEGMVVAAAYDIKSVRDWPRDPRHALEISAVKDAG